MTRQSKPELERIQEEYEVDELAAWDAQELVDEGVEENRVVEIAGEL